MSREYRFLGLKWELQSKSKNIEMYVFINGLFVFFVLISQILNAESLEYCNNS